MKHLPLLNLFLELREPLHLTTEQYRLALEGLLGSLERGLEVSDAEKIGRLFRIVWAKSPQEQRIFDDAFAQWRKRESEQVTVALAEWVQREQRQEQRERRGEEEKGRVIPFEDKRQFSDGEETGETVESWYSASEVGEAVRKSPQERNYFPVSRRQMEGFWSRLQLPVLSEELSREVDVVVTVTEVAKRGFFTAPVYHRRWREGFEVILLVDSSASMVPFQPLCRLLLKAAQGVRVLYFRNVPGLRVYEDAQCWQPVRVREVLRKGHSEQVMVILSDGGAARGRYVEERIEETEWFLEYGLLSVERIGWLNPLPRERWGDTSAEEIAGFAQVNGRMGMFGLEELERLGDWLVGDALIPTKPVGAKPVGANGRSPLQLMDTSVTIRDFDAFSVQGRIAGFYRRYGEGWGRLARYGAFPLVLTADVLYRLWERFFKDSRKDGGVPWYGVADVLLSSLCQPEQMQEEEVYRMERSMREELLGGLSEGELRQLSDFLVEYVKQQVKNEKWAERERWTALAYVQPTEAAQELAEALRRAYLAEDKGQLVQLAALVETLAEPLRGGFEPLLVVGREYGAYGRGVPSQREGGEEVAGVRLEYPRKRERTSLRWFSFEVVTVNRRGEEINRERKQARYFSEDCNGVNLEMVAIPGGEFMMGSPETEKNSMSRERPQHRVTVQPFFMGKYAITQAQWKAVARLPKVERDLEPEPSGFKGENRPVERITWDDAVEFCARLSRYTGKEYRLPSEAEWEYACRAGTTTPFHFGETITTKLANYNGDYVSADEPKGEYRRETTPVGYFQVANQFGLYDMHGNVWEWCADEWHDNYEGATRDGTIWLNSDEKNRKKVRRGGSWFNYPRLCRSAIRSDFYPDTQYFNIGFRVVRLPPRTGQLKIKN
jgi:formylglycine-generating enzyme required for sulfatase activity/uncharacterized protein with von Willebrand factor type A (vWA) domain